MASSTQNVKLGPCKISFDGVDLGYTKGGVEVEVSTDTYAVMVDQFGESEISELVTKRSVKVTAPLAETTLENMVKIMPGATLVDASVKQVSTLTVATAQNNTEYVVVIGGRSYSYTSDADATQGEIALGIVAAVNADVSRYMNATTTAVAGDNTSQDVVLTAVIGGEVVTVTENSVDLSVVETVAAVAGAKRVDVTNAVGTNLLTIAKELRMHPQALSDSDESEDFVVPKAATAGAVQFAYQLNQERIYNVTFTGYPDTSNGDLLFSLGDSSAA